MRGGVYVAWRRADVPLSLLLTVATVVGGGIGNAIDRVALGAVTDFFKTTFMDFAIFNVADIFVTCGVPIALILWWRWDAARERATKAGSSSHVLSFSHRLCFSRLTRIQTMCRMISSQVDDLLASSVFLKCPI